MFWCGNVWSKWIHAACYDISCNVPYGTGFIDNNKNGKYDKGDTYLASGSGCGKTHKGVSIDSPAPIANAMWKPLKQEAYDVFYWTSKNYGKTTYHFTKLEDVNWAPNPNAS